MIRRSKLNILQERIKHSLTSRGKEYYEGIEENVLSNYMISEAVMSYVDKMRSVVKIMNVCEAHDCDRYDELLDTIREMYTDFKRKDQKYKFSKLMNIDLSDIVELLNDYECPPQKVLLLSTGGTLDSVYSIHKYTTTPACKSQLPEYLDHLVLNYSFVHKHICALNSEDITQEIIEKIISEINSMNIDNVVLIHGTATMKNTAKILHTSLKETNKKVIIVGSYYPLPYSKGDALLNIGSALSALNYIDSGVYLCIKGQVFKSPFKVKIH